MVEKQRVKTRHPGLSGLVQDQVHGMERVKEELRIANLEITGLKAQVTALLQQGGQPMNSNSLH